MRAGRGGWGRDAHAPAYILWHWPHPASLQQLEHSLDALHLSSFGLMDTTLEEVFLKVSEEDQSLENSEAGKSAQGWRSAQPTHRGPLGTLRLLGLSIGSWWMV